MYIDTYLIILNITRDGQIYPTRILTYLASII